jgi:hypothetical protein
MSLVSFLEFVDMTAECLTPLTDFADGVHDPLAELTKVFVERKRGSDAEPLHDREAGAVRKTESLVRILTEDGPSPFFVSGSDPNDRRRGLVQQSEPELQGRFVSESHAKEGDGFVNHHIAGNEEPIRGLHVPESLMMQAIGLIRKSKECRGINEDRHTERMGRQVQGFSCK